MSVPSPLKQVIHQGRRLLGQDKLAERRRVGIRQAQAIEATLRSIETARDGASPVLYFNASSQLGNSSFNGVAGQVMTWGMRLAGQPVTYLHCQGGLGHCVMGTNRDNLDAAMPCRVCVRTARLYLPTQNILPHLPSAATHHTKTQEVAGLSLEQLLELTYRDLPLGQLCLPAARWALRRHDLGAIPEGRQLLASFITAAAGLVERVEEIIVKQHPCAFLLFNGAFFPEATARAVALQRGIPVVTFEGGYLPNTIFLSHGIAPEYTVNIPESFQMGDTENAQLDEYLTQRFQGNFTMIGARFWPEMKSIGAALQEKIAAHRNLVTVFTNVVFDTTQVFTNTVFESMFAWLGATLRLASAHPDTLFVVRAHPDELRPGKESRETVENWFHRSGYSNLPNAHFIPPTEYVSSYELAQASQFCVVYNSTIGLEATLLGVPTVMGGKSRYAHINATHFPQTPEDYQQTLTSFLTGDVPPVPVEWQQRARRFLYYSMFKSALRFDAFVEQVGRYDYTVNNFNLAALSRENCPEIDIICNGVSHGRAFVYP